MPLTLWEMEMAHQTPSAPREKPGMERGPSWMRGRARRAAAGMRTIQRAKMASQTGRTVSPAPCMAPTRTMA